MKNQNYVVKEAGIASPSSSISYFGYFNYYEDAEKWVDEAVKTCLDNENGSFQDKDEAEKAYRECYEILMADEVEEEEIEEIK